MKYLYAYLIHPSMLRRAKNGFHCRTGQLIKCSGHDHIDPHSWNQQHEHPVDDSNGGEQGHGHEPEPEEDVDLLVDYVEGEDAEAVGVGDGA